MISDADLNQIEALALASTEGELGVGSTDPRYRSIDWMMECLSHGSGAVYCVCLPGDDNPPIAAVTGNGPTSRQNAEFFSIARKAALVLVAEVRRLRERLGDAECE